MLLCSSPTLSYISKGSSPLYVCTANAAHPSLKWVEHRPLVPVPSLYVGAQTVVWTIHPKVEHHWKLTSLLNVETANEGTYAQCTDVMLPNVTLSSQHSYSCESIDITPRDLKKSKRYPSGRLFLTPTYSNLIARHSRKNMLATKYVVMRYWESRSIGLL